jgi:hypothetical protein
VIAAGLQGAFLLARGNAHGIALVETTPAGAARSFWAAAICLPGFIALRLLHWSATGEPEGGVPLAFAAELVAYVIAWAGYALASRPLADAAGRLPHWPRFIAAWNWANVVQYLVLLALTVPAALGVPTLLAQALGLAALGYAVWLEWFVAKVALDVTGGRAAGFVALDLALGIFLGGLVQRMAG